MAGKVGPGDLGTGSDPSDFDASTEGIVIAGPAEGIVIAGPAERFAAKGESTQGAGRGDDAAAELGSTGRWEQDERADAAADDVDDPVEVAAVELVTEDVVEEPKPWTPDDLVDRGDMVEQITVEPPSLGADSDVGFDA
ncbi:MAG: hypothetical protein AAGD18_18610 [Actinomycetota bacterium]